MNYSLLQVGINDYPEIPLRGCRNDVSNFYNWTRKNLDPISGRALFDKYATGDNIKQELRALIHDSSDFKIFQYSGHGTQVVDISGDERGRYDSAICPVDFFSKGPIIDDELADIYAELPAGKQMLVLFDSCFSGESSRSLKHFMNKLKAKAPVIKPNVNRFMPLDSLGTVAHGEQVSKLAGYDMRHEIPMLLDVNCPPDRTYILSPEFQTPAMKAAATASRRKSFLPVDSNVILISAATKYQTAADAFINNTWQGAGTAALIFAFKVYGMNQTYEQVAKSANSWLKGSGYSQVLRVEGVEDVRRRGIFR